MQSLTAVSDFLSTQRPTAVAIALSGGPDSWALTLLAHAWCTQHNVPLTALTVDHQLRTDSAAEAAAVAAECARRGITQHILAWQHGPVTSALQEQARNARYELLTGYCRTHNIPLLLTAHHADDQAETVLLRFAKSSDVTGLAGLRDIAVINGITVARPLLQHTKQELVVYATQQGVPFVTDPSNGSARFARARLRDARTVLEAEGLTTANITRLADKMRAADEALDFAAQHMICSTFRIAADGSIAAPSSAFADKPQSIVQRGLLTLWRLTTGDTGHPIGHDQLQRLHQFATQQTETKITMAGMVLEHASQHLMACREVAACAPAITIAPRSSAVWDNRFEVHNPGDTAITVGALGTFGRDRIDTLGTSYTWMQQTPAAARAALPAATGLPLLLSKTDAVTPWAVFLPVKSSDTALYSA